MEILLMNGENPVDETTAEFFFGGALRKIFRARNVDVLSYVASLVSARAVRRIFCAQHPAKHVSAAALIHDVLRFEESIAGRHYLIEVASITQDRWRACIVRVPGVPTALMPFYGRTAVEAKQQLSAWLARAYERASSSAGTV